MRIELLLGSSKFQCSDLGGPDGLLEITGEPTCSFSQFTKILLGESLELVPQNYQKLSEHFVSSSYVAPLILPRNQLEKSIRRAEHFLQKTLKNDQDSSYLAHWIKIDSFLKSLHRATIDAEELRSLAEGMHEGQKRVAESFLPSSGKKSKKIVYSTSNSVTGRLTVDSGPQILTATKAVRSCIRSSFKGGNVYEIDFRSIEPRVAMITAGLEAPEDVYQDLLEEFPDLTREAAKAVTLTALYGGQPARVSEMVGSLGTARKSISFVRSHFRIESLERQLQTAAERGLVRNAFGRPLWEATKDPRIRANHFLQSTATELALLKFSEICEKIAGAKPIFVIHDALIIDVPQDLDGEFKKAVNSVSWQGSPLPMSFHSLLDI